MKPTNEELRAALAAAVNVDLLANGVIHLGPHHTATIRAHLETFDEERAFLEAAMTLGMTWDSPSGIAAPNGLVRQADFIESYRALVAKREGK